jgi:hypothetical protein
MDPTQGLIGSKKFVPLKCSEYGERLKGAIGEALLATRSADNKGERPVPSNIGSICSSSLGLGSDIHETSFVVHLLIHIQIYANRMTKPIAHIPD